MPPTPSTEKNSSAAPASAASVLSVFTWFVPGAPATRMRPSIALARLAPYRSKACGSVALKRSTLLSRSVAALVFRELTQVSFEHKLKMNSLSSHAKRYGLTDIRNSVWSAGRLLAIGMVVRSRVSNNSMLAVVVSGSLCH